MWRNRNNLKRILAVILLVVLTASIWWLLFFDNYHEVIPGQLYRSGQMSSSQFSRHADEDGITTVINLRPDTNETWYAEEMQVCAGRGIRHIDFPMHGNLPPTRERMIELIALMRQSSGPMLIHCTHGADRTGLAIALYMKALENVPTEEAARALSLKYGHLPVMKAFDRAFREYCEGRGRGKPEAPKQVRDAST
jgi:protein tyrosine/serine phosphatase